MPIGRLDRAQVKNLVGGMLADGTAPGTARNALNTLSGLCRFAIDSGAIKANPCSGAKPPRSRRYEARFLSAEEVGLLADTIDERYRVLVLTAAYCGLRAGELGALRVGRLDLMRGKLHVVESVGEVHGGLVTTAPKTHETRAVSVPRFLSDLFAEHISDRAVDPDAFVFLAPSGGQLRHSSWRRRYFAPAVAEAGLSPLRFHDSRHTCAALLIELGSHPRAIMERLGHASVTVSLDLYGHLFPSLDEQLTDGLGRAWSDSQTAHSRPTGSVVDFPSAQNR